MNDVDAFDLEPHVHDGLSDLQKWILRKALDTGRVYIADVCAGFYGWKPLRPLHRYTSGEVERIRGRWRPEVGDMEPGEYFQNPPGGIKKYSSVKASITGSINALVRRSLLRWVEQEYGRRHRYASPTDAAHQLSGTKLEPLRRSE